MPSKYSRGFDITHDSLRLFTREPSLILLPLLSLLAVGSAFAVLEAIVFQQGLVESLVINDLYRRSRPSASGLDPEAVHRPPVGFETILSHRTVQTIADTDAISRVASNRWSGCFKTPIAKTEIVLCAVFTKQPLEGLIMVKSSFDTTFDIICDSGNP